MQQEINGLGISFNYDELENLELPTQKQPDQLPVADEVSLGSVEEIKAPQVPSLTQPETETTSIFDEDYLSSRMEAKDVPQEPKDTRTLLEKTPLLGSFKRAFEGQKESLGKTFEEVERRAEERIVGGEGLPVSALKGAGESIIPTLGAGAGTLLEGLFNTAVDTGKLLLPKSAEGAIEGGIQKGMQEVSKMRVSDLIDLQLGAATAPLKAGTAFVKKVGGDNEMLNKLEELVVSLEGEGIVPDVANLSIGEVLQKSEELAEENPIIAANLKGLTQIAEVLPVGKIGSKLVKSTKSIELPKVKLPDVSLPKGKTTEELLSTKETFKITPDFKKSEKLRPKDIDLGISVADKKALGGKSETAKVYLQEALDTHTNPDAGIGSLADSRVTNKMKEVEKQISGVGSDIGKARQSYSKTKVDAGDVSGASKEFNDGLKKLGYRMEGGELVQIKGRDLKLSSAEKSMIKELQIDLKKAESGGNLQEILDRRMNIDTALNKAKSKEGFVDNKTKSLVTGLRKNYKDILTAKGGTVNARLTDEYAEMMGVMNAYNQASAKGKNLEYFLERIMGTRDAKSRKAFDLIKEKTGIDFMEEATAMKLALKVASKDKTSRLQQAFENAGISIASIVNPKFGLVKLAKDVAGEGKDYLTKRKGVDPEFLNAKDRASTIFEAMQ